MESFEALIPKFRKAKAEKAETAETKTEGLLVEEKTELLSQLEDHIQRVSTERENLEAELEKARKSGNFSKFNKLQETVKSEISKAEGIQRKIEGRTTSSEISGVYSSIDAGGKEKIEAILLSFEAELTTWTDFYTKHGIELPADFAEQMQDIWNRNADVMTEAITEKGFDRAIFIPEIVDGVDLKKIEEEMTKSYKEEAKKAGLPENDTYLGIDIKKVVNSRTGSRIILIHSAPDLTAQPELLKTLDKKYGGEKTDGVDNKAEDFIKAGEELTLSEWFIFQREIWEKTGVHLDGKKGSDGYVKPTWCGGSRMGSGVGSHVVRACWYPVFAGVDVVPIRLSIPFLGLVAGSPAVSNKLAFNFYYFKLF